MTDKRVNPPRGGSPISETHVFVDGAWKPVREVRSGPWNGNVLQTVVQLDAYQGRSGRFDTSSIEDAQVVTSMVKGKGGVHRPVLDIDLPAELIPSSTPGHYHLYLDVEVEHENYMLLLDALALCGIIEPGYASASKERGYTAVRLPWVKKVEPEVVAMLDEILTEEVELELGGYPF